MKIVPPAKAGSVYANVQSTPINMTTGTNPAPTPTPSPGGSFSASVAQAPTTGSTISGTVYMKIVGAQIRNAEILPEFGYTPSYARFTVSPDGASADVHWDTTTITDRTQNFRIVAWDQPPSSPNATQEIIVTTRSWTIKNSTTVPSVSVDFYGGSSITGWTDGSGTMSNPTAVQTFQNDLPPELSGTGNNKGVPGQGTRRLLQLPGDPDTTIYNYGGIGSFESRLQASSANYVIVNTLLNDADPNQENNTTTVYDTNLRKVVSLVRQYNKTIIFATPQPCNNFAYSAYLTVMHNVASAYTVPLIDVHQMLTDHMASTGLTITDMMPDGEHPSQATYNIIGAYYASQFKQIIGTVPAPSPAPSGVPAISGPNAADFNSTPTFFDDFPGTTLSNHWNRGIWYLGDNPTGTVRVNNGYLELCSTTASMFVGHDDTTYVIVDTDPNSGNGATSPFAQKYGCFQVRAKLPYGKGYWPAFWLFGHDGNHRPEIDVFETYAGGPGDWSINGYAPGRADAAIHPMDDDGAGNLVAQATEDNHNLADLIDLSAAFHTYTIEWDQTFMRLYFDGTLKWSMTYSDTCAWFSQFQLYIIIGFGLNYSTAGGPSANTSESPVGFGADPNNVPNNVFRVDYVCAWQYNKYSV